VVSTESKPAVHTPTPWFINADDSPDNGHRPVIYAPDPSSEWRGDRFNLYLRDPNKKCDEGELLANARLIVRSVNSHAALVEALRELIASFPPGYRCLNCGGVLIGGRLTPAHEPQCPVVAAERALALAEEQK
jgi:hypothetical protein